MLFHFEGDVGQFVVAFDLHGGGFAGFEGGEGGAEFVHGFDGFAIERVDDVAGAETGVNGEAICNDRCDEHARGDAKFAENFNDLGCDSGADDAEARNDVFCGIAEIGETRGIVTRFVDGENEVDFFAGADDGDFCGVAMIHQVEAEREKRKVVHGKSVESDNDIFGLEAGVGRWAVGENIGNDDADVGRDAESLREIGRERLDVGADGAAADASIFANLLVSVAHDAAGNGEADAFVATGFCVDESVDADDVAIGVHERTAAIAGIDGGVSLDVDHGVVGIGLAENGADEAHADGVFEAFGTAEGEYELALLNFFVAADLERGEVRRFDFEDGEVDFLAETNDFRGEDFAARFEKRRGMRSVGLRGENDADAFSAFDDVIVRDDVAVWIDHDAGAEAALAPDGAGFGVAAVVVVIIVVGAETGDLNFDDGGRDAVDEILE